ncbi:MAG: MFS transporter [Paludibacter sp.]|nr:MFS transporter [Paludibacter sp.]
MTPTKNKTAAADQPISPFLVTLMAVTAGITVANIYYNQPILKNIATEFHATEAQAGIISMLSQVGFGLGLFFITPLGDKINKKTLIIWSELLLLVALVLLMFSTDIMQVWILSLFIGTFSVSVHVVIPLAAGLSTKNRGKTVGTIFTGLLIGILAARVLSGSIAEWFGWRYVYLISAVAVAAVTVLLKIYLPTVETTFKGSYLKLLISTLKQLGDFPQLRRLCIIGMLQFGLFCSFWTTLTFHLSGSPFNFQSDTIGLFGLVAIAGALIAPVIGKRADKGESNRLRFMAVGLLILSTLIMLIFQHSLPALVLGVLLLDIGAQSLQVTNVTLIYTLGNESLHSRINTVYMTSFFIGGALGTFIGLLCWKFGGWNWVTAQMLLFALLIIVFLIKEKLQTK